MFWPCGTIPYLFKPEGAGRTYVTSPILQPFEAAGLREDMIVLYGLRDVNTARGGGGSEGGVVLRTTCANSPGTRRNGGEADDSVAGGPSIDQILLKRVAGLRSPNVSAVNAICDARVDSYETSAQCLSYGYDTRNIAAVTPADSVITEHVPLMPELSPNKLYASLFSGFMPGASNPQQELIKALQLRKSVLDYALGELKRLEGVAPASERMKLEAHAEAIRALERQLSDQLSMPAGECAVPAPPDPGLVAKTGSGFDYANPTRDSADDAAVAELGRLHLSVIRAAFQCDITRVATFQWAPSTNHVAFEGLYPDDPSGIYLHHPMSHKISGRPTSEPAPGETRDIHQFLANVQTWFNARTAETLVELKKARDIFGAPLLDSTIVPYVTDTADLNHGRAPLPAMLFGGRALGLQGGQYLDYSAAPRPFGDVWLTVAQAYLRGLDAKAQLANEIFMQQGSYDLLPGVWKESA